MPHYVDIRPRGIRKVSEVIAAPVAGAAAVLYQITAGGQVPRTAIIRKIWAYSDVGNVVLTIGIGLAAAQVPIMPLLYVVNDMDTEWTEDEIPEVEVNQDITVEGTIVGCQVQIEVEEVGS